MDPVFAGLIERIHSGGEILRVLEMEIDTNRQRDSDSWQLFMRYADQDFWNLLKHGMLDSDDKDKFETLMGILEYGDHDQFQTMYEVGFLIPPADPDLRTKLLAYARELGHKRNIALLERIFAEHPVKG